MPEYNEVKTGDKLEVLENGAVRSTNEGKGRFDLIPVWPLFRLAKHYENGAKKYKDRNWEAGMHMSRLLCSAIRHLFKYLGGDRAEDHLAAAAWNIFAIMDHEERIERGLLDSKYADLPSQSIFRSDEFDETTKKVEKVESNDVLYGKNGRPV
jgi:hypothetical protein